MRRDFKGQRDALTSRLSELEAEHTSKTAQLDQLVQEYRNMSIENQRLTSQAKSMQEALHDREAENTLLQQQMADMLKTSAQKEETIAQQSTLISQQQEALDRSLSDSLQVTKQIKEIQQSVALFRVTRVGIISCECIVFVVPNYSITAHPPSEPIGLGHHRT